MRKLSIFLAFILVLCYGQLFAQCSVTIDELVGSWDDGGTTKLIPGAPATFDFQLNVGCDTPDFGFNIANAFVISSPDAADWGFVQGDTISTYTGDFNWGTKFINHFNKTGGTGSWGGVQAIGAGNVSGTDSIGVLFAAGSFAASGGIRGGGVYNIYTITIQPTVGSENGTICIDTANTPGGQWGWSSITIGHPNIIPEWYGTEQCFVVETPPNFPPEVSGPTNYSFSHCDLAVINFTADEEENDTPYEWEIVSGPGAIVSTGDKTAQWTWNGASQEGAATLVVRAKDTFGVDHFGPEFPVNLTWTNDGPVVTDCPTDEPSVLLGDVAQHTILATDDCDALIWTIESAVNAATTSFGVVDGVVTYTPVDGEGPGGLAGLVQVTVGVSDGLIMEPCTVGFSLLYGAPYSVTIEKIHDQLQGHFADVALILDGVDANEGLGGFDLLVAYDNSALSFQLAYEGDIYGTCNWEYFTYRFGPDGNCGNGCPSGLTRVVGMAETNNGPHHPGCETLAGDFTATLAYLRFLVSNDRTLECQYVPIRFFWIDCGDNTLSNWAGTKLYISGQVFDYDNGTPVNDGLYGFPTYLGAQDYCLEGTGFEGKPLPERYVDFYNGGVDIICADEIDDRGDLNLNGIAYEIADAVMFTNYFIEGLGAFEYVEGAIAASDVNADGIPLTVADLVYLIRVVVGDALPYPKTAPIEANYSYDNNVVSVDAEMGAAFLTFEGDVTPVLTASNMKMEYKAVDGITRVVVYNDETAGAAFEGSFLQVDGKLLDAQFATYEGQPVAAKNVPTSFQVFQNYPNPFNPTTVFSMALPQAGDYKIEIFNVTGQLVDVIAGSADASVVEVEWNAGNFASGVYFYKTTVGDNVVTKKAILLK